MGISRSKTNHHREILSFNEIRVILNQVFFFICVYFCSVPHLYNSVFLYFFGIDGRVSSKSLWAWLRWNGSTLVCKNFKILYKINHCVLYCFLGHAFTNNYWVFGVFLFGFFWGGGFFLKDVWGVTLLIFLNLILYLSNHRRIEFVNQSNRHRRYMY